MRPKKEQLKAGGQKKSTTSLNPDDDPYWKISTDNIDPRKGVQYIERFVNYQMRYPQWFYDIGSGIPTYYAVLGLLKGYSKEELQSAYEKECKFSVYPHDVIEEAYRVLSDLQLRVKYDEFLIRFEHATRYTSLQMIEELKSAHAKYLNNAPIFRKLGNFAQNHHDYMFLIAKGMPNIFEYSGLKPDCSDEEAETYASSGDELSVLISSIIRDPTQREDFVNFHNLIHTSKNEELKEHRNKLKLKWNQFEPELVRKVMYLSLTKPKQIEDIFNRIKRILSSNHDWIEYLPPSQKTFFSIFDVPEDINSLPKSEAESLLRTRYRTLERTSEVNLAYTVLKNPILRDDYIWLCHHFELKKIIDLIDEEEQYPEELTEAQIQKIIAKRMRELEKTFGRIP